MVVLIFFKCATDPVRLLLTEIKVRCKTHEEIHSRYTKWNAPCIEPINQRDSLSSRMQLIKTGQVSIIKIVRECITTHVLAVLFTTRRCCCWNHRRWKALKFIECLRYERLRANEDRRVVCQRLRACCGGRVSVHAQTFPFQILL